MATKGRSSATASQLAVALVPVPMVEIRPVGVCVHDGLVAVAVRVPGTCWEFGMLVRMVSVIVAVGVLVFLRLMFVNVRVTLAGE